MSKLFAVIRVRGSMETRHTVEDGMRLSHLTRKNHLIFMPENPQTKGILNIAKDFTTWGDVTQAIIEKLLRQRSEISGGKKLTDEYLSKNSKFKTIPEFAKALFNCEAKLKDVAGLKPLFRLSPPRKGFEPIKLPYPKGALGYRKEEINELIERMI